MELIVADSAGKTLFPLSDFELDMDSGWGDGVDNTFDLIVRAASAPLPEAAWRVYADGTEMGGRVERFELKTGRSSSGLHWTGSTWSGVLAKRLLWPDAGQDYTRWRATRTPCSGRWWRALASAPSSPCRTGTRASP